MCTRANVFPDGSLTGFKCNFLPRYFGEAIDLTRAKAKRATREPFKVALLFQADPHTPLSNSLQALLLRSAGPS